MGPGGEINLTHGARTIKQKARQILTRFKLRTNDWIFFHLGEPDCRLQLGHGWHPHKSPGVQSVVKKSFLDKCVANYINILTEVPLNFGIIGAVTAYPPAFRAVQYFNHQMQIRVKTFIDAFDHAFNGTSIKRKYQNSNFKHDPLHLNSRIADFFIEELAKREITKTINHPLVKSSHFDVHDVRKDFKMSKFGSFTIS